MSTVNQGTFLNVNGIFRVNWKHYKTTLSEPIAVYNIRDDKSGYPHFLVYVNGEWKYISAKQFVPLSGK